MSGIVFERPVAISPSEHETMEQIAFTKPGTPVERAWADLCDEIENERVEEVIAGLGGWERMIETPITFRDFTAAYYDSEAGALCSIRRNGGRS
jgi:hypothetical protein